MIVAIFTYDIAQFIHLCVFLYVCIQYFNGQPIYDTIFYISYMTHIMQVLYQEILWCDAIWNFRR